MDVERKRASVVVLSNRDTQAWHSPFSAELRRWRRARILDRCRRKALADGSEEYVLFDALENCLVRGLAVE